MKMKPCVVYAMQSCPKCTKTKKILSTMGAVHTYFDLDDESEPDGAAMKAELIGMGHSDFPVVFALGTELKDVPRMHEQGTLADALMKSGSLNAVQRI